MEITQRSTIGKVSLSLALAGIIGAVCLGLCFAVIGEFTGIAIPIITGVLLFIGLEIAALITGIVAWRSPYGKAGLGISTLLLLLITYFVPVSKRTITNEDSKTPVVEVVEQRPI